MLSGKRFKLTKATLGVGVVDGKRSVVTVPAGETITVTSGPARLGDNETVTVLWDGRAVALFAIDVDVRGTEVRDRSAKA